MRSQFSKTTRTFTEKADDLEALRTAVVDAAGVSAGLWFSYIFVLFYLFVAVGSVTHKDLFYQNPIKLPFLNIELPLLGFFALGSLLFLIVHGYVLLHFVLLAGKVGAFHAELKSKLGDRPKVRESVRRQLPSNLFVQILAGPREVREGVVGFLLRRIAEISLVACPITLLAYFLLQFLPYHHSWITWWHRIVLVIDLILLWLLWPSVSRGAQTRLRDLRTRMAGAMAAASILVTVPAFTIATFPGETLHRLPSLDYIPVGPNSDGKWILVSPYKLLIAGEIDFVARTPKSLWSNRIVLPGIDIIDHAKFETDEKIAALPETVSLRGRNLDGAVLIGATLRKADFTGASLLDAELAEADLRDAKLNCIKNYSRIMECTQLRGANLDQVNLQGANLNKAQLQYTKLNGANLQDASLNDAQLEYSSLNDARLNRASLNGANLKKASLNRAHLDYTSFERAELPEAVLVGAELRGARFYGAHLPRASFAAANLQGASLDKAELQGAVLDATDLRGASLDWTKLQGASLNNAFLDAASLYKTNLKSASLNGTRFRGANLSNTQMQGASLRKANFQGATLNKVELQGALLEESLFQGASLYKTIMHGSIIKNANFDGTSFEYVSIWRSDIQSSLYKGIRSHVYAPQKRMPAAEDIGKIRNDLILTVPESNGRKEAIDRINNIIDITKNNYDSKITSAWSDLELVPIGADLVIKSASEAWRVVGCAKEGQPYVIQKLIAELRNNQILAPFSLDNILAQKAIAVLATDFLGANCEGAAELTKLERATLSRLAFPNDNP